MSNRSFAFTLALALLGNLTPALSFEANAALLYSRIPASACAPATTADAGKLVLSNGSWAFSGTESGTANLWCPVLTDRQYDPFSPYLISALRLWYRDPDGMSSPSQVTAELFFREINSSTVNSMNAFCDSNTHNVLVSTTDTDDFLTNTNLDVLFFVEVTMKRPSPGTAAVAFHGLDLPQSVN